MGSTLGTPRYALPAFACLAAATMTSTAATTGNNGWNGWTWHTPASVRYVQCRLVFCLCHVRGRTASPTSWYHKQKYSPFFVHPLIIYPLPQAARLMRRRAPTSARSGVAAAVVDSMLAKEMVAGREYFGRVWTLAERLARYGRKERLSQWLSLEVGCVACMHVGCVRRRAVEGWRLLVVRECSQCVKHMEIGHSCGLHGVLRFSSWTSAGPLECQWEGGRTRWSIVWSPQLGQGMSNRQHAYCLSFAATAAATAAATGVAGHGGGRHAPGCGGQERIPGMTCLRLGQQSRHMQRHSSALCHPCTVTLLHVGCTRRRSTKRCWEGRLAGCWTTFWAPWRRRCAPPA